MNTHPAIEKALERAKKASSEAKRLAEIYGYLPYMIERYIEMLGEHEAKLLLEANEKPLDDYIRCNNILINCNILEKRLQSKGVELASDKRFSPYSYRVLRSPIKLGALHEHLFGYYYIQGPASAGIVHALDPRPGETVLDMAAAPGGKSTQILQLARDKALLVAVEKNRKRVRSLRANLQRMRFTNYIILRADSTRLSFNNEFDRVLLDAPSTGEGIIRRDPSRKRSRAPHDLLYIHKLQVIMLSKALDYVKPGGIIVYAACTLAPEEGEMVIDTILSRRQNVTIEPHGLPISRGISSYFGISMDSRVEMCGRFWPHRQGTEGFFVCKLRKNPS